MAKVILLFSLFCFYLAGVTAESSKDFSGSITLAPGNYTTTEWVEAPFWISYTITSSNGNFSACTITKGIIV